MHGYWPYLLWFFAWIAPVSALTFAIYWLFTLPLRRQERSRFLLDLLESGYRRGQTSEASVESISRTRDRAVGVRFHLLAEYVRGGLSIADALARVPSMASPQVAAMLRVGEKLGDVRKVFSVCRGMLKDANSQTRNAVNYAFILLLVGTPALPLMLAAEKEVVMPKFQGMAAVYDVEVDSSALAIVKWADVIGACQVAFTFLVCAGVVAYVGGPRLRRWMATIFPTMCDHLMYRVPWRRKRLRRDFASMLAMLLDANVPEQMSIQMAAAATANCVFMRQGEEAVRDLQSGLSLSNALRRFDRDAEFAWRISNAAHASGGFSNALSGWVQALDAKAFQQEQAFSQIVSTAMVFFNGFLVASVVLGLFGVLIEITNKIALW